MGADYEIRPGHGASTVSRLLAGPPLLRGYERLDEHAARLGRRPAGGEEVLDIVARSGLRGRGGAGFPTWRKWAAVANCDHWGRTVVVNGSEGEPLSRKDRTLIAFRPHLVLDGAALAAESVGARQIVLYIPREAADTMRAALEERARAGLREPPVRIVHSPHRYVSGESSAVVNRVSGGAAQPSFALRSAATSGYLIQNVETLAHAALIARQGSDWFRLLGTDFSPGTALVTLCGHVGRPGVYEVDLAGSLGAVLDVAGRLPGSPGGVLLGGYFGTWLAGGAIDRLPLDAERLRSGFGASLGCGVVAVLPPDGCGIVESARIARYLADESAGQCGPCVHGLAALAGAIERLATSRPDQPDVDRIRRWTKTVAGRGACRHPDGAVAQLQSAISVFDAHLQDHLRGEPCHGVRASHFPRPPERRRGWR